jgi:hypothetical protein
MFEDVQVIEWDVPAVQLSPPLGEVTLTVGVGADAIVNRALLTSVGVPFEAWLIRTRQLVEAVFETVHA